MLFIYVFDNILRYDIVVYKHNFKKWGDSRYEKDRTFSSGYSSYE